MSGDDQRVVAHADAAGTPIVMIHGVGDDAEAWAGVAERLGADRPLVRYTLRGHLPRGRNAPPPYEMGDFVSDVVAIIDDLGAERVVLAGFSLGGLIAQATVLAHPERVAGAVVVGSVADRTPEEQVRVRDRHAEVVARGPYEVAKGSVDRWYTEAHLRAHPDARDRTLERMSRLDPDCYASAYGVLAENDFAGRLHEVRVPVLAIAGEGDIGSPPHMSQYIADHVQHGRAVVVPNVKHSLLQEAPDTIAKELIEFVTVNQL